MDEAFARLSAPWNSSSIPEVGNAMAAKFSAGALGAAGVGGDTTSKVDAINAEYAKDEALKAAIAKKKELEDSLDPKNWQQIQKEDGGYDFIDGTGKKVDVWTYSKATGKSPIDLLKNSQNSLDIQFKNDWSNLQDLLSAFANNDQGYIDDLKENDPDTYEQIRGMQPADLMRRFKQFYPNVFGGGGNAEENRIAIPGTPRRRPSIYDQIATEEE